MLTVKPFSVSTLADPAGLSRSAFAERFRAAPDESPIRYLTRYRLEKAASYLRTIDAGLRDISRSTGYESEVSISKAFRRWYGMSPGACRRSKVALSSTRGT
ncbi:MAG TPA: AraC family transcriptional regulator [Candidatus Dormibacteraeota bacterium]